ncbi:MAG: class B sortase [Oscillospiraceae bacterium]|jgi:sortase B|nr:class B sortase [Oscillospiraceae bacterium]
MKIDISKNKLIIIITAIVLFAAAAVSVFFWLISKQIIVEPGATVLADGTVIPPEKEKVFQIVSPRPFNERRADLIAAKEINPKAFAWLSVPGTNIEYPVILDPENDNSYWLQRKLDGTTVENQSYTNAETVVYAHYKGEFPGISPGSGEISRNLTFFGHNWNNCSIPYYIGDSGDGTYIMFEQLMSFTDYDFSRGHQYIYLATETGDYVYQVFSSMYCEPSWKPEFDFNYFDPSPGDAQFETLLSEMKERSLFDFDVPVSSGDKIITLSTCTLYYEGAAEQRYVVSARLLGKGEKADRLAKVEINRDYKKPSFVK